MQPLDSDAQLALLERLMAATHDGRLAWERIDADEEQARGPAYSFSTKVNRFGYVIQSLDRDDSHPYRLTIYEVTQTPPSLVQAISSNESWVSTSIISVLEELYILVKRSTLKFDDLAKNIFDELDDLW